MVKSKTKRKIEEDKTASKGEEKQKDEVENEAQSDYESDQVNFLLFFDFSHVLLFTFFRTRFLRRIS